MEVPNCDALAGVTKIKHITSDECKKEILRRIKRNDPDLKYLCLTDESEAYDDDDYYPSDATELGWLGHLIGKNTQLQKLDFQRLDLFDSPAAIALFCKGIIRNRSIRSICFRFLPPNQARDIANLLMPFFLTKTITDFDILYCELDGECCRQISLAIGRIKSLRRFSFVDCDMINDDGKPWLAKILMALSMKHQLCKLDLNSNGMGRDNCLPLEVFLGWLKTPHLKHLHLEDNQIGNEAAAVLARGLSRYKGLRSLYIGENLFDDKGLTALAGALEMSEKLEILDLACCQDVTNNGWKELSSLLARPVSKLRTLNLGANTIGEEVVIIFANALRGNCELASLEFSNITSEGLAAFSQLICDCSTMNSTFHSNHKLSSLGRRYKENCYYDHDEPQRKAIRLLCMNKNGNKEKVAMMKVLMCHEDFDLQALFGWELKLLPFVIGWFERASQIISPCEMISPLFDQNFMTKIPERRLSAIYDYIRGMPMLSIGSMKREEKLRLVGNGKRRPEGPMSEVPAMEKHRPNARARC